MLLGAKCNLPEQWLYFYISLILYCFLPPRFLYFSTFLYVSPSCLLTPLSHCSSFSISLFFFPLFCISVFQCLFSELLSPFIPLSLCFSFSTFFIFPSFPSSFNACYPNRCLPAVSKVASPSSSSFLPLLNSFCYLFLSDIPAFLFVFCLPLSIPISLFSFLFRSSHNTL